MVPPKSYKELGDKIELTYQCFMCNKDNVIVVDKVKYNRFLAGAFAQNVWPELSSGDREVLISGTHNECWNEMWPDEDEIINDLDSEIDGEGGYTA